MGYSIAELAAIVSGTIRGDESLIVHGANPIQDVGTGELTLLDSSKHLESLQRSKASAVVVSSAIDTLTIPQIVVSDVHEAFQKFILLFRPSRTSELQGIHRHAHVDASASVGLNTWIGEGATVGRDCSIGERCKIHRGVHVMDGCHIGDDCELFPGVVLYPDTQLGHRVTIHSNAVLGAYGFGYKSSAGRHLRSAQLGSVQVDDDVEIGANTTIDRGTYGKTSIGEGTKIDNLVMIAHNCKIGKHNLICSHVGIAGSSTTGNHVVLAGQVGLKDHVTLGDRVIVAAQSGIASDVESGSIIMGSPAQPIKREMQCIMVRNRLPDLREQLRTLESTVRQWIEKTGAREEEAGTSSDDHRSERKVA